jgi:hypothetical protein
MTEGECLARSVVVVLPEDIDVLNAGSVGELLAAARDDR